MQGRIARSPVHLSHSALTLKGLVGSINSPWGWEEEERGAESLIDPAAG